MQPARIPVIFAIFVFFIAGTDELAAQFRDVALSPDRLFGILDRNRNGMLEIEELDRIPLPMRETLGRMHIDLKRPVSKEAFFKVANRLTEELQRAREERFSSTRAQKQPDSRSRTPDNPSSRSSRPSLLTSRATVQARPRVTVDLPENYHDRDKNGDGQIGLYEWDHTAFAEFFRLDRNGDGFLTPRELTPTGSTSATSTPIGSSSKISSVRPTPTPASTPTTRPLSSGTTTSTPSSDSATTRESKMAAFIFRSLDKNHDGSLSADEWERSQRTRQSFEKANIRMPVPVHYDQFADYYLRVARSARH